MTPVHLPDHLTILRLARRAMGTCRRALVGMIVLLLRGYQLLLSPVLPATCRYLPTCSDYAAQAVARHGPLRGCWLAARRVARCHPWGDAGYDPVPDADAGRCQHVHKPLADAG